MAHRRRSIEIEGVGHSAPIPMGCRIDEMIYSSAIMGSDPASGELPASGEAQVRFAFENMRSFLKAADATTDDVIRMTVLLRDMSLRSFVNKEWLATFPDESSRPARHAVTQQLNGEMQIQLEVIAVASDR